MASSWQAILDEVQLLRDEKRSQGVYTLWFRGQQRSDWLLLPRLHRLIIERDKTHQKVTGNSSRLEESLINCEKTFYNRFRESGILLLEAAETNPWGILFAMQHYGVPTRLLDWSESFLCAVYFAQDNRDPESEAAIYVLDPQGVNWREQAKNGLISIPPDFSSENNNVGFLASYHPQWERTEKERIRSSACVAPPLANRRMLAQQARFVLCSDQFDGLESELDSEEGWLVKKVLLPRQTYSEAQEFLYNMGVGPFHYFPDLPGLAEEIRRRDKRAFEEQLHRSTD